MPEQVAGGDVASPSTATFSEQPQQGGFVGNAKTLLRKYWYIALALAVLIAYLIYNYMRSSSAQVGTTSTTADPSQPDTSGLTSPDPGVTMPPSGVPTDTPSAAALPQSTSGSASGTFTAPSAKSSASATPAASTPAAPSSPLAGLFPSRQAAIAQKAETPGTPPAPSFAGLFPSRSDAIAQKENIHYVPTNRSSGTQIVAPKSFTPHPLAKLFPPRRAAITQRRTAAVSARATRGQAVIAQNRAVAPARRGRSSGMQIGGPPPSGPSVPFGTHVAVHDPLDSSGSMYANSR